MRAPSFAMLVFVIFAACGCRHSSRPEPVKLCKVTVFAASSLGDLVQAIGRDFVDGHPSCTVSFNLGASNTLGLQLEAGARADVFLSAAEAPVDHLIASGKIEAGPKRVLFSNRLAFVSNLSYPFDITSACALKDAGVEHIAIGQPDAVPAGMYAKGYLSRLKCADGKSPWSALESHFLPMSNVRSVLSVVEQQPKISGFVYRSDALSSKGVKLQFVVQGPDAPHIDYFGVCLGTRNHSHFAEEFLAEFTSARIQRIIRKMGFIVDQS